MNNPNAIFKETITELTSYIQRVIDSKQDPFGLSIALTSDEGLIWTEGFGYTDNTKAEPVTPDTLFSTQSMGKCFTATAFLILASKNLVHLDDSIRDYYPEFGINTKFNSPDSEIARITFRRMLSHTAGLTHEASVGNNYDYHPCTFEDHIESISEGWLKFPVGSEMSYSNLGYDLTAYVMGLIRRKTFPEFMTEELFQTLGVVNATYDIDEAMKKSFAKGYDGPFQFPTVQIPMLGAGGLFISAMEVAKFISFHLRRGAMDGEEIIRPHLFEEMYRPLNNEEFGYGFGLYTSERIAGAKVYGHGGGGYGYQTNMMWIPDFKIGVAVLSNNMKQSYASAIAKKALELLIQDIQKTTISLPKGIEDLSGTYVADGNLSPQFLRIFSGDGKIFASQMDGTIFEMVHKEGTTFTTPAGTTCTFELDTLCLPKAILFDGTTFPFRAKYNDGPWDERGQNKKEWEEYLGIYQYEEDARPAYLALSVINGHLYLTFGDNLKLREYVEGVFFTADGEVLELGENEVVYKGITAKKAIFDRTSLLKEIAVCDIKYEYYRFAVMSLLSILYSNEGIESALDFMKQLVEIDAGFKVNYGTLGKRLYALGFYEDAIACLQALIELDPEHEEARIFLDKMTKASE